MRFNQKNVLGLSSIILFQLCLSSCSKEKAVDEDIYIPRPVTSTSSKFINKIYEYQPAPGQFINESLGSPDGAQKIIGDVKNTSLVSLGAFGGFIVFGFDHSILNKEGNDLAIYGNPLGPIQQWSEPGIVQVSQDKNGNGLPDEEWYELAGSEHSSVSTIKNYEITYYNPKATANVTWKDNQGKTGSVDVNRFHNHNYYPLFAANQDSVKLKGTLLKSTWGTIGSIFVNNAFEWGYTDSYSTGDDYATKRYNSFDLSNAIDKNGKAISLNAVDFIKVYTGQNEKGNTLLGEISTEVGGAADLNIK